MELCTSHAGGGGHEIEAELGARCGRCNNVSACGSERRSTNTVIHLPGLHDGGFGTRYLCFVAHLTI